ncbi:hypothetical protein [Nocardia vulneris]|uniref:hypothetical protein n=1 Tax=Nocardia vulneris TaxID=1141657 RepID=UPI000AA9AE51|nr:hypothetical protein [Nocardia vulneris]
MSVVHKGGVVGFLSAVAIGAVVSMAGPAEAQSVGGLHCGKSADSAQWQHMGAAIRCSEVAPDAPTDWKGGDDSGWGL